VYYEPDEQRKKTERTDVAICRVEQLCPFPYDLIQRELKRYPSMSIDQILQFIKLLSRVIFPPPGEVCVPLHLEEESLNLTEWGFSNGWSEHLPFGYVIARPAFPAVQSCLAHQAAHF
jgi:hypothetical protein